MRIFSCGQTMKALSAVFGKALLLTTAMDSDGFSHARRLVSSARPMLNIVVGPAQ